MAQGVRIETEASVRVQTPTRGLMPYFQEIVLPIISATRGKLNPPGARGRAGIPRRAFVR